jgi:YVTN family beta-propeller protein
VSIVGAEPYAYITNSGSNTVSAIDIAINKVTSTVNVGDIPCGVAVTPDGKKVYVTNAGRNNVSIIDTTKKKVASTMDVESEPFGVAINPAGTKVYVTNIISITVSVINTMTNTCDSHSACRKLSSRDCS